MRSIRRWLAGPLAGLRVAGAAAAPGSVLAWGSDAKGQLGDGTVAEGLGVFRTTPKSVVSLSGVVALAGGHGYVGLYAGYEGHSLALKGDGTVWAWGDDSYGQLGDGTPETSGCYCSAAPHQVVGLTGVAAITAGSYHSLALRSDGTVWAWGADGTGALGDGTVGDGAFGTGSRAVPIQVVDLGGSGNVPTNVVALAGGGTHSLALKGDGTVWAWGANASRQLGDGGGFPTPGPMPTRRIASHLTTTKRG